MKPLVRKASEDTERFGGLIKRQEWREEEDEYRQLQHARLELKAAFFFSPSSASKPMVHHVWLKRHVNVMISKHHNIHESLSCSDTFGSINASR